MKSVIVLKKFLLETHCYISLNFRYMLLEDSEGSFKLCRGTSANSLVKAESGTSSYEYITVSSKGNYIVFSSCK